MAAKMNRKLWLTPIGLTLLLFAYQNCGMDGFRGSEILADRTEDLGYHYHTMAVSGSTETVILDADEASDLKNSAKIEQQNGVTYLAFSEDENGEATYRFSIENEAPYTLWALVKAPASDADSIFISLDGASPEAWHFGSDKLYRWVEFKSKPKLKAGQHQLKVLSREKGVKISKFELSASISSSTDESDTSVLKLGAAQAKSVSSPMRLVADSNSPSEHALYSTTSQEGEATFEFSLSDSGTYNLRAEVFAPSGDSNSLFIQVEGHSQSTWHLPVGSMYAVVQSSDDFSLNKGSVNVTIRGREAETRLAHLSLVKTSDSTSGLDPNKKPGQNFDLSWWKINLPVDEDGQFDGRSLEVSPIPSNYDYEPYFYTASDGAMVFMSPVEGARTGGTKYPRSELRELDGQGDLAYWTVEDGGTLSATLAVNELPKKDDGRPGRIVIGQIHGPDDELCRLYYDKGELYFHDDKAGSNHEETRFVLKNSSGQRTNIPLNAKFSYKIEANRKTLTVTAKFNGQTYSAVDPISSFWPGKKNYFKAGVYVQVGTSESGANTTGYGQAKASFYELPRPMHP